MSEEKFIYVDKPGITLYDSEIKDWFDDKVNQVETIQPVYHDDERILEFKIVTMSSGESSSELETCTITFPENNAGETIYYTDGDGVFITFKRTVNETVILTVLKNSIVASNLAVFDDATYVLPNTGATSINGYAFSVYENIELGYADDATAPQ